MHIVKRGAMALIAVVALAFMALEVSAGTSHDITHSTCAGYGHTHQYATYTGASTTLTGGSSSECWRYLAFAWWDDYFQDWNWEPIDPGYFNQWKTSPWPTPGKSLHQIKKDGVVGFASVETNSWQ